MARKIQFEGRTIEVPDDATDDEVAEIITAATPPTPIQSAQQQPAGGSRQVTPTHPDAILSSDPRTTDRGFWGEFLGSINPREIITGLYDRGLKLAVNMAAPLVAEDEGMGLDMTDVGAPDLPGIYKEAKRRGESNESLAGMYGSAAGQALLSGLGLGASRMIRTAPARMAAAEADYADAVGTSANPAMTRSMMDRGIVVRDAPAQAAVAADKAADLVRWGEAMPKPRGKITPAGLQLDSGNAAISATRTGLANESQFQANLAKILEAMPEDSKLNSAKTIRAVRRTGGTALIGGALTGVPHSITLPIAAGLTFADLATQLTKSHAWKTAAPIHKYRFMNAMLRGDADAAAAAGALIATGAASNGPADGSNGGNNTTTTTAAATAAAGAAAPNPLDAATARPAPPPGWAPYINHNPIDHPFSFTEEERKNWPNILAALDENTDWLTTTSPSRVLPPHLKSALSATVGTILPKYQAQELRGMGGVYGAVPHRKLSEPWSDSRDGVEGPNTITLAPHVTSPAALYHEYGHAIVRDLSPAVLEDWESRFNKMIAPAKIISRHHWEELGRARDAAPKDDDAIETSEEEDRRFSKLDALSGTLPGVLPLWLRTATHDTFNSRREIADFQEASGEALAEAFAWYIVAPRLLLERDPGTYGWLAKNVFKGREYINRDMPPPRTPPAAATHRVGSPVGSSSGSSSGPSDTSQWSSEDYWSEFNPYDRPFEGTDLIVGTSPSALLPERFRHARKVSLGQEFKKGSGILPGNVEGVYGYPVSKEDRKGYNSLLSKLTNYGKPEGAGDFPHVTLARDVNQTEYPLTVMHEYGHAAWRGGDVTPEEKARWRELHDVRLRPHRGGHDRSSSSIQQIRSDRSIPRAIRQYSDDPGHSFAEMFGLYVAAPTEFKQRYPREYAYFRDVFGREYDVAGRAASRLSRSSGLSRLKSRQLSGSSGAGTDPAGMP